jgi:cytochrome c-type biogenesis protein CcmF
MVPELGLYLLITALMASVLSLGGGFVHSTAVQIRAQRLSSALVFVSFLVLAYSFYQVDLTLQIVYQHADHALPALYRIGAVWGGHEGSMLLWMTILNGWIWAGSRLALPPESRRNVMMVLSAINLGFLLFVLIASNPFARYLPITPLSGQDLNPFLQDPVMLIHPPILYMGYLGFVLPFALAMAALWEGHLTQAMVRIMRVCVVVAWSFLTIGIALGSFWAYYELGWGGWWFWDPVENASLMPWLAGAALFHLLRVTETRRGFATWAVLLSLLAFMLSILGTFLVRSGALTSVHSFANDPARGVFILCLLAAYTLPALVLFSLRGSRLHHEMDYALNSREGLILANNVLLMIILGTVLLGTLYPLIIESLGMGFISVGAPYFNAILIPLGLVLGALMAYSTWTKPIPLRVAFQRVRARLPIKLWGMYLAHLGFGVLILGITLTTYLSVEDDVILGVGETHAIGDYRFTLDSLTPIQGPNFTAEQASMTVTYKGALLTTMKPEKRFYTQRQMPIAQIALDGNLARDLYVALAEPLEDHRWVFRIQVKPFIRLIWLAALLMASGGILSIFNHKGEAQ